MQEAFTLLSAQIYMTKADIAGKSTTIVSKGRSDESLRMPVQGVAVAMLCSSLVAGRWSLVGTVRYWQRQIAVSFVDSGHVGRVTGRKCQDKQASVRARDVCLSPFHFLAKLSLHYEYTIFATSEPSQVSRIPAQPLRQLHK